MDGVIGVLAFLAFLSVVVLPITGFALSIGLRKRVQRLEADNLSREKELRWLYSRLQELERKKSPTEEAAPATAPERAEAPATAPIEPVIEPPPAPAPAPVTATQPTAPAEPAPPEPAPLPIAPPPPPPPREPALPLEQRVAFWLTRAGAGAVILALLYFFKYMVDHDWIGPTGRVAVGIVLGVALIGGAERLARSTRPAFVQLLVGIGLAALFISVYASSAFYDLLTTEQAFAGNALVLFIGAALAHRHRGEAILVLVLIATFLNPWLLSTGKDRPFALFSYLFVVTSVAMFLAVKLRFAVAMAVAIAGTVVLFGGWYGKFFEVHDWRQISAADLPQEQLVGAYLDLATRIVPVVFVALFGAQWIAAGLALKRLKAAWAWSLLPVMAALIALHAGWASLLYDHVYALGGAMVLAGAAAVATLWVLERTDLLLLPMISAFVILSVRIGETATSEQHWMLVLLGAWTLLYVAAFLRSASDQHREISPGAAIRAAVGLGVFAILGAIMLLPAERTVAFALLVTACAGVTAIVAHRARLVALVSGALIVSALGLGISAQLTVEREQPLDPAFLLIAAAWSAVHAGAIFYALIRRREVQWNALLTFSLAILGFVALVIGSTRDDVPMLRALLTALAALTDLALATWIHRKRPELEAWVSVLAAQALGLVAAAAGLALSGASITVVWAVLTTAAAMILARSRDPVWGVAVAALAGATLIRVIGFDVAEADRLVEVYRWSGGRSGVYQWPALFNPRAYALIGAGLGFVASAATLARGARRAAGGDGARLLLAFAPVLAVLGHALLIGAAVSEGRAAALILPEPPPMPLDGAELSAFLQTVFEAEAVQRGKLAMITTLILASAAMLLLGGGFAFSDKFHRYLGLVIFVATVVKLVGWDIRTLERTYQIVVLAVVGALLLGSGFLYARLKTLFTRPSVGAGLLLLLLSAPLATRDASAQPDAGVLPPVAIHEYQSRRTIDGVPGPGDHRVPVDLDLYRASLSQEELADVRITTPELRAVPHLARDVPPLRPEASRSGTLYDPGQTRDGGFQALFQVPPGEPHCQVELELSGAAPFLRRTRIEAGETESDLRLVARGGLVYGISAPDVPLSRKSTLRYPPSIARYVRVTLEPDPQAEPTEITGGRFFCHTPEAIAPVDRFPLKITGITRDAEKKKTIVELDAGAEGVPIERLQVRVATAELVRRTIVSASSFRTVWPAVCSGVLYRVEGAAQPDEGLTLHTGGLKKRWIRLEIEDGDDAPLEITGVDAELRKREIVFRAPAAGAHLLFTGDKDGTAASYDLERIFARRRDDQTLPEATLGPVEPNPNFGKEEIAAELPFTEKHRGIIGSLLTVLLLGVAVWAVRLLRTPARAP